ncbi:MAG: hypothetical protein ACYC7D_06720 [Nitrososphaerales archaeon]
MPLNLKKLQANGRRRLGLKGEIEFRHVSRSGVLATSTNSVTMSHTIAYSNIETLDAADVFHELCRAKLDEFGFKTIEAASLSAIRDCCKDDPKYIIDANSAVIVVSEVYSNWLLFTFFPEESNSRREELVLRFESTDALTSLHTRMGFWGTAGISYYRVASKWANKHFPSKQVQAAIARARDGTSIAEELAKIEPILSGLPRISSGLSDTDQILIVDSITKLFSAKTGIECD